MELSMGSCVREVRPEYRPYNLEPGDRLDRTACLTVCERLFRMDAALAGDQLTDAEREALVREAKKMCWKLEPGHDTLSEPIEVEVRSVPVHMYGNALRHYYLRVEDVLDVHPGTNHLLALAWWHNSTQQESDGFERRLFLCGQCFDAFLSNVWTSSERFNIVYNNCDQMLNRCEQSTGLGVFLIVISMFLLFGDVFGAAMLLLAFVLFALTCRRWYGSAMYAFRHPHYRHVYLCQHAEQPHGAWGETASRRLHEPEDGGVGFAENAKVAVHSSAEH